MIFKLCVVCCLWLAVVSSEHNSNEKTSTQKNGKTSSHQPAPAYTTHFVETLTRAPTATIAAPRTDSSTMPSISDAFDRLFNADNLVPLLLFGAAVSTTTMLVCCCAQWLCRASRRRRGHVELQMTDVSESGRLTAAAEEEEAGGGGGGQGDDPASRGINGLSGPAAGGGGGIYEVVDDSYPPGQPDAPAEPTAEPPAEATADNSLTMIENQLYRSVGQVQTRPGAEEAAPGTGGETGGETGPATGPAIVE